MPRKQWAAFERVTAADVNTNLADQSVMVFATTATRDAAIPSPTVGMQSAVTASPDLGAPRYWDGSAWTLVKSGAAYANVLTLGASPTDFGTDTVTQTWAANTWYQLNGGVGSDSVVFGVQGYGTNTFSGNPVFELGVGPAGSEVVRASLFVASNDRPFTLIPYGAFVPAGSRYAIRANTTSTSSVSVAVYYISGATVSASLAGRASATDVWDTTWRQVASSGPTGGSGVWVTGFRINTNTSSSIRLGTGGAGSEVAKTGYSYNRSTGDVHIPPFFWPTGDRLAMQLNAGSTTAVAFEVLWRESLS